MNAWLLRASLTQLSILMWCFIAPAMVMIAHFQRGHSWPRALVLGLLTAAICAPILSYIVSRKWSGMSQTDDDDASYPPRRP